MNKKIALFLYFIASIAFAQQKAWRGYFSFNEITDVVSNNNHVVASTKNSLFDYDTTLHSSVTQTSINGIKPDIITTIFKTSTGITLIGNENGYLIVVKPDGTVINKPDIILEVPVPPNIKRINHFNEYNGIVYIATEYGITEFKLNTLEFGDTYKIENSGLNIDVLQTTVFNNEIYAVTRTQGIKKAVVTNPFIYDFSQWTVFDGGFWTGITTFNNQLVAANSNNILYRHNGSNFVAIGNFNPVGLQLKSVSNHLLIVCNFQIQVFNQSFINIGTIYNIPGVNDSFTSATIENNKLYIGTKANGLYETDFTGSNFTKVSPLGPYQDFIFKVKKAPNDLWINHGAYERTYTPDYKLEGISIYNKTNGWEFINKNQLNGYVSLGTMQYNPNRPNEMWISSHHSGLIKITDKTNLQFYNNNNSPLESVQGFPGYTSIRNNGLKFDSDGNMWLTNAFTVNGLKVFRSNNSWQSYNFSSILQDVTNERYGNLDIDKNGTKWIPTFLNGLLAFNEKYGNKSIIINTDKGLPDNDVRCVAVDNKNQVWIGTFKGLRIINSADRFLSENSLTATNIVIQEGDLAQELFYQQFIQDIYVDGANNKWVSIGDAGVFLVSPNGQTTLRRFTKDNSPLPSNNVYDIEVDEVTGEVFFATDRGLVSFLGSATKGSESLENVYAYPNPVRPNYTGTVKIAGLTDKANVKITDIEGNLVYETTSAGGTIEWDTTAFGKHKVASGVYMVFVVSEDGGDSTVKKVMIVR